jgi:putative hydrolase of HD superfamily
MAARLMARWDEYSAVATPEARMAKGLDRLETVMTHAEGANPPDFDYAFNLGYGREHTDRDPLVAALRAPVDAETARLAGRRENPPPALRQRLSCWLRTSSSPRRVIR